MLLHVIWKSATPVCMNYTFENMIPSENKFINFHKNEEQH